MSRPRTSDVPPPLTARQLAMRNVPATGISLHQQAFDYVVCVLDWRIGDVVGYPGATTYDNAWNGGDFWQTMGYPNDLAGTERPTFQSRAVIINHHLETTQGQTGLRLDHLMDATPGHPAAPFGDGSPTSPGRGLSLFKAPRPTARSRATRSSIPQEVAPRWLR